MICKGSLLGSYSKINLLKSEAVFTSGSEYSIFEIDGVKFGINICYDLNFPGTARGVALKEASFLLCPCNNMLEHDSAEKWKYRHNESRIERAKENSIWVISSDVTGMYNGRISFGPTAFIGPDGKIIKQAHMFDEALITHEVEPVVAHNSE